MEYAIIALLAVCVALQVISLLRKPKSLTEREVEDAVRRANAEFVPQLAREIEDVARRSGAELSSQLTREFAVLRDEFGTRTDRLRDSLTTQVAESRDANRRALTEYAQTSSEGMDRIRDRLDERLEVVRKNLETGITAMQSSNEKKLEEMRQTVNEKLEKTLESRLQKSFETVSAQLESVNRGLGEMKTVADSVGSLNRALTNVKTRGILGELQLGQIIEDMLPPGLYDTEVATKPGSRDRVEYAVKLPGADADKPVYLPIDSKFPLEDYYRLVEGYDNGDTAAVESARKALLARVKTFAKDVRDKYVSPPETTNFAVIFLPTEGLYAEIVRDAAFFDGLRRDGVIVAGPTTLSAMLNSLQVGFKTLQMQKGAADIEKTLGLVKKEFETFETVLKKAHERITQAGNDIEILVGTRTRAINRSLRSVQTYQGPDAPAVLGAEENTDA